VHAQSVRQTCVVCIPATALTSHKAVRVRLHLKQRAGKTTIEITVSYTSLRDIHMSTLTIPVHDRTGAPAVVDFLVNKLAAYDTRLLDWIRIYPMTEQQHQPQVTGEPAPVTLSTCWPPRETWLDCDEPQARHKFRIKVNVWQGEDYPAMECNWGRVPARPIRRRSVQERYTTRGLCEWSYPDRLSATVHAMTRAIFLYLAQTHQLDASPSNSNASTLGHRWAIEWLHNTGQATAAEALSTQLVKWHLIQSAGLQD